MKSLLAVSLLLLLMPLLTAKSSAQDGAADPSKLMALENAWNQAQLHHDASAVGQILPETFVYTDYDGTVMNKSKFLADVQDPNYHATSITNQDMEVFPYQNAVPN